jgi:glutamate-1-semialdehyde 2,1-aminomutase
MTARTGSQPVSSAHAAALREQSVRAFARAQQVFPGGTTRMTITKNPFPIYMAHGAGCRLTDIDGNSYIDFHNNFAVLIHGHAFAPVVEAVTRQVTLGTCFANPTLAEIDLAETLCERFPGAQQLRFCNSGTEAVMFAIKAARAATGRRKIAKLEGAFHGLYDWAEVSEASRPENWGPLSAPHATPFGATPAAVLEEVVPLPFNFIDETRRLIETHARELAAVLICLMPSRAGLIPLEGSYLQMLREVTAQHGILLIDDEVLNGRATYAGAAGHYGLEPDLVTLGKIIGGGLPIGAVAGRREVMAVFDNTGRDPLVPHAGTFSANPLSMVAGQAAMHALTREAIERLNALGDRLRNGVSDSARRLNVPFSVTGLGSAFKIHPKRTPPRHFREAWLDAAETSRLSSLWRDLLESGFMFANHGLGVLSTPMDEDVVDSFVAAFAQCASRHTS